MAFSWQEEDAVEIMSKLGWLLTRLLLEVLFLPFSISMCGNKIGSLNKSRIW